MSYWRLMGDTAFSINEYISSITYSTGTQAGHVVTISQEPHAKTTNLIPSTPTGTISFAPMAIDSFYAFLDSKQSTFTLQLIQYVTGNLDGETSSVLIENVRINELSGGSRAGAVSNEGSFSFVATNITHI